MVFVRIDIEIDIRYNVRLVFIEFANISVISNTIGIRAFHIAYFVVNYDYVCVSKTTPSNGLS